MGFYFYGIKTLGVSVCIWFKIGMQPSKKRSRRNSKYEYEGTAYKDIASKVNLGQLGTYELWNM